MRESDFDAKVRGYISLWKPRLILSEWDIRVEITTSKRIGGLADCLAYPRRRTARIRVAIDGHLDHADLHDLEQIIVHELLHCYWPHPGKHAHIGVEAIAWALVNAYRSR